MKKKILQHTLRQYIKGELNEEEVRAFLILIQSELDRELVKELLQEELEDPVLDKDLLEDPALLSLLDTSWGKIQMNIHNSEKRPSWPWRRIAVAAAISIVALWGLNMYFLRDQSNASYTQINQESIIPGKQSATLTLASGKKIQLHEIENGEIVNEFGVKISKTCNGELIYEVGGDKRENTGLNTLATTKGETYRIKLPDGSLVWLNAASSLTYPTQFDNKEKRIVELNGEAYFEVAKDSKRTFIVKTRSQEIEVLGTHFNINSYINEPTVQTTLLEGCVLVRSNNQKLQLLPGQQANLSPDGVLRRNDIEAMPVIAWTKNEFMFDGDDIENVMRKIERWYNVDVVFKGKKTSEKFGGGISRFDDVQKVLNLIQKTGAVHFNIEGKTIYVITAE